MYTRKELQQKNTLFIELNRYIVGADDTGLCGRFSRGFLAHDMGLMYQFAMFLKLHMTWE
jgi:hypothetical protein